MKRKEGKTVRWRERGGRARQRRMDEEKKRGGK